MHAGLVLLGDLARRRVQRPERDAACSPHRSSRSPSSHAWEGLSAPDPERPVGIEAPVQVPDDQRAAPFVDQLPPRASSGNERPVGQRHRADLLEQVRLCAVDFRVGGVDALPGQARPGAAAGTGARAGRPASEGSAANEPSTGTCPPMRRAVATASMVAAPISTPTSSRRDRGSVRRAEPPIAGAGRVRGRAGRRLGTGAGVPGASMTPQSCRYHSDPANGTPGTRWSVARLLRGARSGTAGRAVGCRRGWTWMTRPRRSADAADRPGGRTGASPRPARTRDGRAERTTTRARAATPAGGHAERPERRAGRHRTSRRIRTAPPRWHPVPGPRRRCPASPRWPSGEPGSRPSAASEDERQELIDDERRRKRRKRILIGTGVTVGVVALVAVGYAVVNPRRTHRPLRRRERRRGRRQQLRHARRRPGRLHRRRRRLHPDLHRGRRRPVPLLLRRRGDNGQRASGGTPRRRKRHTVDPVRQLR